MDPAPRRAPLWRNRDYLLLWSGQGVSVLGSQVSGIALPLLVLALTGSAAQAGFVSAAFGLPYLLVGLPAGALVDRWDRKRVMILCDAGRALNAASIPLAAALGHLTMPQLYVNAVLEGTLFIFFNVAEVAGLAHVVGQEQLASASAQNEAATNAASLGGPPLGGFIYQTLGRTAPFVVDAVSYAVSVLTLIRIRTTFQTPRATAQGALLGEIKEGLVWFWRQPLIRFMAVLNGGVNFVMNGTYLILIVLAKEHHARPTLIGVMLALGSVGGLLGSLGAPRLQHRFGFRVVIAIAWYQALLFPLFAIAPNALLLGSVYAALVLCAPINNAVVLSYRLALIPDHLQGRVNSAVRLITYGCVPLGVAVAGVLLQTIGAPSTVLAYAGIMVLLALFATLNPHVRHAPPLVALPATP